MQTDAKSLVYRFRFDYAQNVESADSMGKKGVSLVFEQVLLFMIGFIIFLVCFSVFTAYEGFFSLSLGMRQMEEVNEMVCSSMLMFSGDQEVNSTLEMSVPVAIAGEPYYIRLTQEGLNLTGLKSGRSVFSPLNSINKSYSLSGVFSTVHCGRESCQFLMYKRGDQIIIGANS